MLPQSRPNGRGERSRRELTSIAIDCFARFGFQGTSIDRIARAAGVTIQRLQIGRISVDNVEAVVLDDKALDGTLIGVSFLKRLSKYQVENGALLLVQ